MGLYRRNRKRSAPLPMPSKRTDTKPLTALTWLLEQGIWCTQQKPFRVLYDQAVLHALAYAQEHGDFSQITRLVNAVPDAAQREQVAAAIEKAYPQLAYSKKARKFKKNSSYQPTDQAQSAPVFSVFQASNYSIKAQEIVLHQRSYHKTEAVELLLDVLTQYRNELTLDDLRVLEATMARIADRAQRAEPTPS